MGTTVDNFLRERELHSLEEGYEPSEIPTCLPRPAMGAMGMIPYPHGEVLPDSQEEKVQVLGGVVPEEEGGPECEDATAEVRKIILSPLLFVRGGR